MSTGNASSSGKTLWFGIAVSAIALIGALVYIAGKLADVSASNKRLLQELANVQELLEQRTTYHVSPQGQESGAPDHSSASELTDIIRSELKPIAQSIANLKAADCGTTARQPQALPGMPALPMGGMPSLPRPGIDETTPGGVMPFSSALPKDTQDYVDSVFRKNKEEVRRRIAEEAETQSGELDPIALQRIMEESGEDLRSQLEGVLPQEDFEALFPPFAPPPPVRVGGARGQQ